MTTKPKHTPEGRRRRRVAMRALRELEKQNYQVPFPEDYRAVIIQYWPMLGRVLRGKADKALAILESKSRP